MPRDEKATRRLSSHLHLEDTSSSAAGTVRLATAARASYPAIVAAFALAIAESAAPFGARETMLRSE